MNARNWTSRTSLVEDAQNDGEILEYDMWFLWKGQGILFGLGNHNPQDNISLEKKDYQYQMTVQVAKKQITILCKNFFYP